MKTNILKTLVLGVLFCLLSILPIQEGFAGPFIFDENFDDDFCAGRNIPNSVDAALSSPFAPIDDCRPNVSGKLDVISRDISSFTCPPPERTSCCGPALGFQDGGGQYVTFRYQIPGIIADGSFISFEVVAYGGDGGGLFKYVSTDGVNFTPIGTTSDAMGKHQFPLPAGTSKVYFRLQTNPNTGIFGGIMVDNFHAELFDSPQPPVSIQEGGGTVCIFNAEPFCGIRTCFSFDENFDDDFCAKRNIPDGVDATLSSPFAPIDDCRPNVSGKLDVISRDISSFTCPPHDRTSCCGPALGFQDGGGQFVTFRYSIPGTISTGSFVSFKVIAYGSDGGGLLKYTSTDGVNFTPVGTNSDAMGKHQFPLPTGTSQMYFRLQTDPNTGIFGGIMVDNFHAELFSAPQTSASIQEGGGPVCIFNALPFCAPIRGDVNKDGRLSGADVVTLINCAFVEPGSCDLCSADVNCTGNLSGADVVIDLNIIFLEAPPDC